MRSNHRSNFARSRDGNRSRPNLRAMSVARSALFRNRISSPAQRCPSCSNAAAASRRWRALHIACLATFFSRPNAPRNNRTPRFRGSPRARPGARDRPAGRTVARCRSRDPMELAGDPQARLVRMLQGGFGSAFRIVSAGSRNFPAVRLIIAGSAACETRALNMSAKMSASRASGTSWMPPDRRHRPPCAFRTGPARRHLPETRPSPSFRSSGTGMNAPDARQHGSSAAAEDREPAAWTEP